MSAGVSPTIFQTAVGNGFARMATGRPDASMDPHTEDGQATIDAMADLLLKKNRDKKHLSKRGKLKSVFNAVAAMGAGAGAAFAVKTLVATTIIAAPPVGAAFAIAAAAGAVGGLASRLATHFLSPKKEKLTFKSVAKAMAFGALGGGLCEWLFGGIGAASESVQSTPAPEKLEFADLGIADQTSDLQIDSVATGPGTLTEQIADRITDMDLSEKAQESLSRLSSENAAIAAQAKKDFGTFFYNGMHGLPQDQAFAVELFKEAASEGNVQAARDLAFVEFHGNSAAGIERAVEPALEKMETLVPQDNTGLARAMMDSWTAVDVPAADVPAATEIPAVPETPSPETPSYVPEPVPQTDSITLNDGTVFEGPQQTPAETAGEAVTHPVEQGSIESRPLEETATPEFNQAATETKLEDIQLKIVEVHDYGYEMVFESSFTPNIGDIIEIQMPQQLYKFTM